MALNLPAAATPPIVGGNDPLQQLRLAGIFNQGTPPYEPVPGSMINQPGELGGIDELGGGSSLEGYEPSYEAMEAFQELLSNFPTEGRGILQKIAISMIGAKDPRLAASLMNQPTSAQQDWQQQIGPAQAGMTQERLSNTNLRILADQMLRGGQAERRLGQGDIRLEQTGERLGQGDIRLEQAGQRLEETGRHNVEMERLAQWKSEHPNYQLKVREDGMIVGINPQNPQDVQETGVDSGKLSDQDKLDAGIEAAGKAEAGRVSRQERGIEAGQENIQERERLRAKRSTKPGMLSEAAKATRIVSRAQKLINEHPDWAEWITIDGRQVTVSPEAKEIPWGFDIKGPAPEIRKQIMNAIYGDQTSTTSGTDTGDSVKVISPDGKTGTIPASQLGAALKEGYTRAP